MSIIANEGPRLSAILATDNYDRVKVVIDALSRQSIADKIELVLVTDAPEGVRSRAAQLDCFHSVVVHSNKIVPLGAARAAGVRAASAPYVFIAETHAYPDADLAETLVERLEEGWSLVVPGLRNSNPRNGISWAAFLGDYGAWSRALPAGEIQRGPAHNTAFRRDVLLEFGDGLEQAFGFGDDLYQGMRARGQRSWFEPNPGVEHVNIERFGDWFRERFLSGTVIGGARAKDWTWGRRLLYIVASPLIPFVILSRIQRGVREVAKYEDLPAGTIPAVIAGAILKIAGEVSAYAFGPNERQLERMTAYEIRKLSFNEGKES